jgi:polyketide synthase PksN
LNSRLRTVDLERVLRQAISQETKIPEDQLREDEPLESYGVESVMSVAIVRRLEETFGDLSKTLLFEYQTIESLLGYFEEEYAGSHGAFPIDELSTAPRVHEPRVTGAQPAVRFSAFSVGPSLAAEAADHKAVSTISSSSSISAAALQDREPIVTKDVSAVDRSPAGTDGIAIIGISGRFPEAKNLEEFWEHISQGHD